MISDHTSTNLEKKEENLSRSDCISGTNSPKRTEHRSLPPRCRTRMEGETEYLLMSTTSGSACIQRRPLIPLQRTSASKKPRDLPPGRTIALCSAQ
ncbi:hypothetical protein GDO81_028418 [Engystomops pustulosus]|uniref:Uncharacterized protein n=1 Tax=Engystomops pustulosus TaxID=76066 RepID=A0AAV6YEN4_ENGPU|nr:hypothetical protein GDO81_028418 [Engystomops pustulosus]